MLVDGECASESIDVGEGKGSYAPTEATPDTAAGEESTETTEATTPSTIVIVTFLPNTDEIKTAAEACASLDPVDGRPFEVQAVLVAAGDDTDAESDGPFTVQLAETGCSPVTIEVEDEKGQYRLAA